MVTKVAMITMKAGIRTLSGIKSFTSATTMLAMINTKVVASPIPKPFMAEEVTPRAGHIPSKRVKTAFSLKKPFEKFFHWFISRYFVSLLFNSLFSDIGALRFVSRFVQMGSPTGAVRLPRKGLVGHFHGMQKSTGGD